MLLPFRMLEDKEDHEVGSGMGRVGPHEKRCRMRFPIGINTYIEILQHDRASMGFAECPYLIPTPDSSYSGFNRGSQEPGTQSHPSN